MLPVIELRLYSGRTGSTLLMQLLATSPQIAFDRIYAFEHRYIRHAVSLVNATPMRFTPEIETADELALQSLRAIWDAYSTTMVRSFPHARYYAEKSNPRVDIDFARRAGVPWRVIELVRDPRDVLVSIRGFNRKLGYHAFGRQHAATEEAFVELFITQTKARLAKFNCSAETTEDRMFIRYEDAVLDLAAVSKRLGDWLGVDLDATQVLDERSSYKEHMTSDDATSSIQRWKRELPQTEQDLLTSSLQTELAKMGYATA